MTETPKPRKKKPVEKPDEWLSGDEQMTAEPEAVEPTPEPVILDGSRLVAYNEVARNSNTVRQVQAVMVDRGQWSVAADPSGYWGQWTEAAGKELTGETEPVKVAEALGFRVI